MISIYVYWRAKVHLANAGAAARLARAIEELATYPRIVLPVYNWEPGDSMIGFGFWVEGTTYAPDARAHAKRALEYALRQSHVGTPKPPPGLPHVALAVELEDHPTLRCVEA